MKTTTEIPFGSTFNTYEFKEELEFNQEFLEEQLQRKESLRLRAFTKSCTCVNCGRKGSTLRWQKAKRDRCSSYHLGLWSDDNVQFTKDHIVPKSNGGTNHIDNIQTLCEICNVAKDSKESGEINSINIIFNKIGRNTIRKIHDYNRANRVNEFKDPSVFLEEVKQITECAEEILTYARKENIALKKHPRWITIPKNIRLIAKENFKNL